jgi:hypothetical protein
MLGDWGATAELAVEQSGQMCEELDGPDVRSAQKWNCAARKTTPRSKASSHIRCELLRMYFLRRSLGKNGCGVKGVNPVFACAYILYWVIV